MAGARKTRLDELLVARGLFASRAQARGFILAGKVRSGTVVLDKPGKPVAADTPLEIEQPPRFVSRGGEKLAGFLKSFPLAIAGRRVLDIGASTGGFTDCLLQAGAVHSTCVDVGRAQLHHKIAQDPRVTNIERLNARTLDEAELPHSDYDIAVIDVSFISLRNILPPVWRRVIPGGVLVALIKPQFEAGKAEADAGRGVIRDPAIHERVVAEMRRFAESEMPAADEFGFCPSPIEGADGNREFLIGWKKIASTPAGGFAPTQR
ncbi:MAG: TlyA family RNA methyltransferase [Opitutales bacterium]|nr:TlyA family RNA methyltransferase [Opitutales bacterium]